MDLDVSFCSHGSDSLDSLDLEAHCNDSLLADEKQDDFQGGKTNERICGNNQNNRNDREVARNEYEFQTLVKRHSQQDHFMMDDGQDFIASIESDSQVNYKPFLEKIDDQENDDCSSNSSLCFSSFSPEKENIPDHLTTAK